MRLGAASLTDRLAMKRISGEEYTYVIVESSLYDNDTDRLVWTAKSETMDGTRFDRLAASVADEITCYLVDLDLLQPSRQALALGDDTR